MWEHEDVPVVEGLWVDIFPLYNRKGGISGSISLQRLFSEKFLKYQRGIVSFKFGDFWNAIKKLRLRMFAHMLKSNLFYHQHNHADWKNFIEFEKKLDDDVANIYISYRGLGSCVFLKEWFDGYVEVPFADFSVRLPIAWHDFLKYFYSDYMTPPNPLPSFSHNIFYVNLREHLNLKEVKQRIKKGEHIVY